MWGRICSVGWDEMDAQVVCGQLGYTTGFVANVYGDRFFPLWFKNIGCNGTEDGLVDCDKEAVTWGECYYEYDAGVRCYNESGKTNAM